MIYFTDTELTADNEHELRSFVSLRLLLPKRKVIRTLDGFVSELESQSEVMQAFVLGAERVDVHGEWKGE